VLVMALSKREQKHEISTCNKIEIKVINKVIV